MPARLRALPFMPGVARLVGDGFVDGQPFDGCPRQVLRRQVRAAGRARLDLQTGIEPEFFLLRQADGRWLPADAADRLDKPSYDLKSLPRRFDFLQACAGAGGRRPETCCRSTTKTRTASTKSTSCTTRRWPAATT
jgi:glutamine synthetase